MHSKGMAKGLLNCYEEVDLCEHCIYGKYSPVSFSFGVIRDNEILELIHNDVF